MTEPDRSAPPFCVSCSLNVPLGADGIHADGDHCTRADRSAPLSVEHYAREIMYTISIDDFEQGAQLIKGALSAAYAEGVRTGRRQALEEAADTLGGGDSSVTDEHYAKWLRERATRGDEAHAERTQP